MLKRLQLYFREMHPFIRSVAASVVLFFEIYFFVVLIEGIRVFEVGIPEMIGCITIFTFLLSLRIADDFKDFKTDCVLFPHRPLPSGRVHKRDLIVLLVFTNVITCILNIMYMNNIMFYLLLMGYGTLMSVWFFARTKIQKNLPLALITHNPIGVIINLYIISFTCFKYDLPLVTLNTVLVALTLYWPTLIWEVSRKTYAPQDETDYVTYSKLFGYKKVVLFILGIVTVDVITSSKLMYDLWAWGIIFVVAAYLWFVVECIRFITDPKKFKLVKKLEVYELVTEVPVIVIEICCILGIIGGVILG